MKLITERCSVWWLFSFLSEPFSFLSFRTTFLHCYHCYVVNWPPRLVLIPPCMYFKVVVKLLMTLTYLAPSHTDYNYQTTLLKTSRLTSLQTSKYDLLRILVFFQLHGLLY